VRKVYGVAGAAHMNPARYCMRYAWPSGDWGSLPIAGGLEAAYKSEIEAASDPAAKLAEIEARLNKLRSPFRSAEGFIIEEIIDPRDTRRILTEFAENAAPLIILIMGLGMQLIAWPDPFCEKLAAAGFRVIRFDNRDIGLSTYFDDRGVPNMVWQFIKARIGLRVRAPYDLNDMAADTVGLMDVLQIDKAHIVGASMGGMIAQQIAAKYPARVRSLVSIMSTSGDRRLPPATREAQRALFAR